MPGSCAHPSWRRHCKSVGCPWILCESCGLRRKIWPPMLDHMTAVDQEAPPRLIKLSEAWAIVSTVMERRQGLAMEPFAVNIPGQGWVHRELPRHLGLRAQDFRESLQLAFPGQEEAPEPEIVECLLSVLTTRGHLYLVGQDLRDAWEERFGVPGAAAPDPGAPAPGQLLLHCRGCGKPFSAKRATRKWCSTACRQRNWVQSKQKADVKPSA